MRKNSVPIIFAVIFICNALMGGICKPRQNPPDYSTFQSVASDVLACADMPLRYFGDFSRETAPLFPELRQDARDTNNSAEQQPLLFSGQNAAEQISKPAKELSYSHCLGIGAFGNGTFIPDKSVFRPDHYIFGGWYFILLIMAFLIMLSRSNPPSPAVLFALAKRPGAFCVPGFLFIHSTVSSKTNAI